MGGTQLVSSSTNLPRRCACFGDARFSCYLNMRPGNISNMAVTKKPSANEPHAALVSTAEIRGVLWAERNVRTLMLRWPRWKRTPRTLSTAGRQIADLAGGDIEVHARLAVICHDAAGARFTAIVAGGRAEPAPSRDLSADDEIPK